MKKTIQFNFLVCKNLHEKRTKHFYNSVCKNLIEANHLVSLFSGFDQFDDIPVIKACDQDDYESCIPKLVRSIEYHYDAGTDFDFFFIGDDDTYINIKNLEKLIPKLSEDELFVCGDLRKLFFYPWKHIYGGSGILMNRKTFILVAEMIKNRPEIKPIVHYSDTYFALLVGECNKNSENEIKFINEYTFCGDWGKSYSTQEVKEACTIHLKATEYEEKNIYLLSLIEQGLLK